MSTSNHILLSSLSKQNSGRSERSYNGAKPTYYRLKKPQIFRKFGTEQLTDGTNNFKMN